MPFTQQQITTVKHLSLSPPPQKKMRFRAERLKWHIVQTGITSTAFHNRKGTTGGQGPERP